jgi:hypothetical protein
MIGLVTSKESLNTKHSKNEASYQASHSNNHISSVSSQ